MTVKRGTSQACAACKYQRRRCTPDCALAPYFPADKPKMFQNAHRLFGVCNIMKILKQLREDQKEEAMKSIIYESDMRERFPVFGCSLVILQLNEQLGQCQQELCYVNSLLNSFRNKNHCNGQIQVSDPQYCANSQFQLGLVPCNDIVSHNNYYASSSALQYQSNNEMNLLSDQVKNLNVGYLESSDDIGIAKPLWIQQNNYYGNNMSNNGSFAMKPEFVVSQGLPLQQEIEVVSHDYDDMPFDTFADDRQSYIESKEACESSAESPLKDTMQSTIDAVSQNHELKSAAACFRLTSVN